MAFTVNIDINRELEVQGTFDTVFDTLADVPYSASHFPKVDELVDLGDECYRWEMEKIGLDRWFIQTIYASEYCWDKEEGWVEWYPIVDEGNARISGKWTIEAVDDSTTRLALTTQGEIDLSLPSLAKVIVKPLVIREFEGMVDTYLKNLQKTWTE
ncbi:MAG: SRPBCC family protein [Candidatus Hydrogenedentes bacterium]|nr:SRPBCC family protein [Candidatus Hydrogenedentota bacterium]